MSAEEKIVTDPTSKGWVLDTNTGYYTWTGGSDMGPIQDGDTDGQVTTWSDSAQEWTPDSSLTIDAAGNVGIGTDTPAGKTHISAGASNNPLTSTLNTLIVENDGNAGIGVVCGSGAMSAIALHGGDKVADASIRYIESTREVQHWTGGQQSLTIDAAGNVGIGTASPSAVGGGADLAVSKSGGARFVLNNGNRHWAIRGDSGSDDLRITARGSSDTVDVDALTIDPTGDATFTGTVSAGGGVRLNDKAGLNSDQNENLLPISSNGVIGDGVVSLGRDTTGGIEARRFKDGFFSGTVYANGSPLTRTRDLIKTLTTLRQATMDETQDIRESLRSAIDELVEGFEQEIAAMPVPEEPVTLDEEPEAMDD